MDKTTKKLWKFPKIPHLPWSENADPDDIFIENLSAFEGREVVVTEKLDGECTSIYRSAIHARSVDSRDHWTRHWVKGFASAIQWQIPEDWRICGENVFGEHSIAYDDLESYFYAFGIFNNLNRYIAWDHFVDLANEMEMKIVPVLYYGIWDEEKIRELFTGESVFGSSKQEGYVVRVAHSFSYEDFAQNIAKFVRKNHVQTSDHWMHGQININGIRKNG